MSADPRALTVTLDLEDHRQGTDPSARYRDNAARLLEFLDARGVRATLFVVGDVIAPCRELLGRAAGAGHELALHSATHDPLTALTPDRLRPRLAAARDALEDVGGAPVRGFRAPVFSLTPATPWVPALLTELGFEYSSSVLPAPHPLHGYPDAPRTPVRWPCGLIELPVPLARLGPAELPFLGGIYLRYLPPGLVRRLDERLDPGVLRWTYLHPYDVDAAEGYYRFPGTSALQSLALWRGRRATLRRLARLLDAAPGGIGAPLAERVADRAAGTLPCFGPLDDADHAIPRLKPTVRVPAANAGGTLRGSTGAAGGSRLR